MRNKLQRERKRIDDAAGDREHLSDHGVNFAVTAWHLTDWVWRDIGERYDLLSKIAKHAGVSPSKVEKPDLDRYLCAQCPQLMYCQAIATASKHVGCDTKLLGQGGHPNPIEAEFSSTASTMINLRAGWVLKITDGDRRIPAAPVFDAVLNFWTEFIYGNQIDQPEGQI
jgi:hypothetical protein